jgi:hypothetical protein
MNNAVLVLNKYLPVFYGINSAFEHINSYYESSGITKIYFPQIIIFEGDYIVNKTIKIKNTSEKVLIFGIGNVKILNTLSNFKNNKRFHFPLI